MGSELGNTASTVPVARMDGYSIFWIVFCTVWTSLIASGMAYLWRKRKMSFLRIRSLYLSFAGIVMLHLYMTICQLAYIYGPIMPEVAEYWVMGLWLPFGIALFQAANSQFLEVAKAQKKYAQQPEKRLSISEFTKNRGSGGSLVSRLQRLDYEKRMLIYIGMAMLVQVSGTRWIHIIEQ